ncbi:hypothetical protein SCUCBS95973_005026 [Sporothrix curviconia]|uniref:Uncharacterized protein n=1 Tax=Sporothrix curviconia TaxID=1260050 RepID=A0ABP0BTV9_9PEZI
MDAGSGELDIDDMSISSVLQEQEITKLRFSLNDAKVATDALDAEKRQLKLKNEQLERKLKLAADGKVQELAQQLQRREADRQKLQATNEQLATQLANIPERNFQALTTCVKKILCKLDDTRSEILTDGKAASQQHQEQ